MIHARCVDTVALFPHARGAPYRTKLAHLTERYLARKIQEGSHDSVADARAPTVVVLRLPSAGCTARRWAELGDC